MQIFKKLLMGVPLVTALLTEASLATIDIDTGESSAVRITLDSMYKMTYGIADNDQSFRFGGFTDTGRFQKSYSLTASLMNEAENGLEYGIVFQVAPDSTVQYISPISSSGKVTGGDLSYTNDESRVITNARLESTSASDLGAINTEGFPTIDTAKLSDTITKSETKVEIKGSVELEKPLIKSAYLFVKKENDDARFSIEAGRVPSVATKMNVDAGQISYGSGGINGHWRRYANLDGDQNLTFTTGKLEGSHDTSNFIKHPGSYSDVYNEDEATLSTNFLFEKPECGVKLGLSYTPSQGDLNSQKLSTGMNDYKDVLAVAISKDTEIKIGNIMVSATKEVGIHEDFLAFNRLNSSTVGVMLKFNSGATSVAGSYGNFGKSGLKSTFQDNEKSNYWTLGFSHDTGSNAYSVSYFTSRTIQRDVYAGIAKLNNIVLSAEHRTAQGLVPFLEVSAFSTRDSTLDTKDTAGKLPDENSGVIVMLGSKLSF